MLSPADCAPGRQFNNGSCLRKIDLEDIIHHADKDKDNNKKNNSNNNTLTKKDLLNKVNDIMQKYNCDDNDQFCWMNTKLVKGIEEGNISLSTFKPVAPKGKYNWLSTSNINEVMIQYMNKYDDFVFYGALPYDFDILDELEINNINFDELMNDGKTKIGIVVNLDNHDESGSHWVAIYSQLDKDRIYFFDSFGKRPGKRLTKFIRYLLTFMYNKKNKTNISLDEFLSKNHNSSDYDVRFNKKQHQFKNSECGVYSMNFIIRLLNGETFKQIVNNITDDTTMNQCRQVYFRKR